MARDSHRTNHQIRVREVRLVGDNVENGVYSKDEALRKADELGLDLVEISPNAKPPVCKITDYSKFKYEQKKREKELKAKASKTVVKEIRFGPNTDKHDLDFKTKHAIKFLNEGNKVKAYVHFHGRTIIYKDRGKQLLKDFAVNIQEYGKVEGTMRIEGRRMIMFISPNAPKK
ncbi:translation initiation factor IF-3 [Flammeovirga kamogawensis]|uniref:Translation initiation factor IF-3 n=1 Tax=Flammeovirga kamogawensis TaxID=373891 RepID=A0ABX8GYH4_9BACT|nr:translation initiation factor IF-3 [Flammeovirga kamogawensis]MBB6460902.1 translation initiation factor IF-3 [Flammeovirga kamogawensis]QWG08247.1 translation initiation factor IF-3 [Flammeovirga kamogawensis]TRX70050.1 translation initiation factor IF-3 [Flammeovirga kamogawensis]